MQRHVDVPVDQFVTLGGVRLHYLDWGGAGDPLLLLAGLGCTAHVFAELAPHLSDRFRVLALTRRGHGFSDQVPGAYAIADSAEDARRLLDALGIDRAHVAGHSMGGAEVSVLATRHPERVAKVVYLDGTYDWADNPAAEWPEEASSPDTFASYEEYVDFVHSLLPDDIRGPALDAMLRASVDIRADGSVVDKHSGPAFASFVQALKTYRHPYADIAAPALAFFAVGDQCQGTEATWRAACRDRFAAETADAHVVELHASHYLFIDRRDDVVTAMREFLSEPSTWVWIWSSAEIVALDSFGVGDLVAWDCRDDTTVPIDLPPGIERSTLLIEDADFALGHDDDFVEVSGRVIAIHVAHDRWGRDEEGDMRALEGTRSWSSADRTHDATQTPPRGGASGYLVELAPS